MDAIGNSDSVIGVACEGKSGELAEVRFYAADALLMADAILRQGARMAVDATEERRGADAQKRGQFLTD